MKKQLKIIAYVLWGLLVLLVFGPFFVPLRGAEGTATAEELAADNGRFVDVDGLQVYYEQSGSGDPVLVLLHGFGASAYSWRGITPRLAMLGTVIAYDRPAFGFTERPMPGEWQTGVNPYQASCQPQLLIGLLDELGIDQAILVGHSAGGRVAVQTALAYPERVSALVLVDPALYGNLGSPWLQALSGLPQVNRLGPRLVRSIQTRGVDFIYRAWHDPALVTEDVLTGYQAPLRLANWDRALWELSKAANDAPLANRLAELDLPALVVTGDNDQIVPAAESIRAAQEIPGAQLAVFTNCGHVPHEECGVEFLAAVEPFLAGLSELP